MGRSIRYFVAKLGDTTVRALRDGKGIDGLLILEPWPPPTGTGYLATVTEDTWRWLPTDPAAFDKFSKALRRSPTEPIKVVLDHDLYIAGRRRQRERDKFAARRRTRVAKGEDLAPVVGLWVARQRRSGGRT